MLLGSLTLLVALAALGAWGHASISNSRTLHAWLRGPAFQLQTVLILGLQALEPGDVLTRSGLRAGTPLVDLPLERLRARIEADARIRHCHLARIYPHRLLLAVDERRPVARLAGSRVAVDREGVRFPLTAREGARLPQISGDPGPALAALAAAERAGLEIESIRVRAPRDLQVRPRQDSVVLRVGADAARAFGDWLRLRSSGALRGLSVSEVDLRFRGNAILARRARVREGG